MPNRPVFVPDLPAEIGHTPKNNPFGNIFFTATNATHLVRTQRGAEEWSRYLTVYDLNNAYWTGNADTAVVMLGPCTLDPQGMEDADQDTILDLCDNCSNPAHPGAYKRYVKRLSQRRL